VRVLITGAAGAGTTTLGRALAERIGADVLDADDYFWLPSMPPYQSKRPPEDRIGLMLNDLRDIQRAVISGSIVGWGRLLEDSLSMVVFLSVPSEIRVARLRSREMERYGHANEEFLRWASQYDEGRLPGPSRAIHERWLEQRKCPILRIEGNVSTAEALSRVAELLSTNAFERSGDHDGPRQPAATAPAARLDREAP
jgi:adenylate kinase family enzyme